MPNEEHTYITVAAAAHRYGVDVSTIRRGISAKRIPCLRVGRAVRLDPAALDALFLREAAPDARENDKGLTRKRP